MIKKLILFIIGAISLMLGTLGIFLPILPTTPFVLLAATCFAASSPRMNERLTKSKRFGEFIRNYREHTGVRRKTKRNALIYLWVSLLLSGFIIQRLLIVIILIVVGSCVSIHILSLKTAKEETDTKDLQEEQVSVEEIKDSKIIEEQAKVEDGV